ncbi:hypothetical protein RB601_002447 [Gaeumannomyces tritici]
MYRNVRGNPPNTSFPGQSSRARAGRAAAVAAAVDGPTAPDAASASASASTTRLGHGHGHSARKARTEHRCTVTVNESFSRDEVLLNLDLLDGVFRPGCLVAIDVPPEKPGHASLRKLPHQDLDGDDRSASDAASSGAGAGAGRRYLFIAKDMSKDLKTRYPNVELYVAKHIAEAFGMRKGGQVYLTLEDSNNPSIEASHVELSFRDQYLSRSDMWRMTVGELSERTVYQGQVIFFLGAVKAQVTAVFVEGRKVQSAFFGRNTRPIYRSESARYIIFIQMAREMWDFDSDGSGEIMFNKVVNGFLPALFKKWAGLKLRHLVSIVLFARVEYDTGLTTEFRETTVNDPYYSGTQPSGSKRPYKDFYRVVVSERTSTEWTSILYQLKREFGLFRRDISLYHHQAMGSVTTSPDDMFSISRQMPSQIKAESSLATHGNFLEAINLASSVYAHDYIDRDLMRTGISVVVISPGSGVFDVEYEALRRTTEALVGNGIGIDLICVPKMPLHSVPLFRYRNPQYEERRRASSKAGKTMFNEGSTPKYHNIPIGSYSSAKSSFSPSKTVGASHRGEPLSLSHAPTNDEWCFALPQWLHVSYWTGASDEALSFQGISVSAADTSGGSTQEEFAIRCRMYDLQMRSVLETNEIETTPLHADPSFPRKLIQPLPPSIFRRVDIEGVTVIPNLRVSDALFGHVYGFQKFAPDKHAKPGEKSVWRHLQEYDETRCHLPSSRRHGGLRVRDADDGGRRAHATEEDNYLGVSVTSERRVSIGSHQQPHRMPLRMGLERLSPAAPGLLAPASDAASVSSRSSAGKAPKFLRQISLGQRGFGIAAPKAALAVQAENVAASTASLTQGVARGPVSARSTPTKPPQPAPSPQLAATAIRRGSPTPESATGHGRRVRDGGSRPIHIRNTVQPLDATLMADATAISSSVIRHDAPGTDRDLRYSNALRAEDAQKVGISKLRAGELPEMPATLSPATALSPWLTILNPSNPDVNKIDDASLYSRWQHVFPRPSEMKVMKWKSLCAPAAVPLTTEYFPTKAQFDSEYQRQPYNVSQELDDEPTEEPKSREEFLKELVSLRFSQGFQVVVGQAVAKAFGQKQMKVANILSRDHATEDGTSIFMSVGNTIHQLSCVNGTEVEITIFTRKPAYVRPSEKEQADVYSPAIRTILDPTYDTARIDIVSPKQERNWNYIDSYLAGHELEMSDTFRFWRARFVLIPMASRTSAVPASGDSDEEIRIEGIRRLGQLWLKHRYIPPAERRFQNLGPRWRREVNPLDVVYKTEDPSVVIAAELETLPLLEGLDAGHRRPQLVTNRNQFRKSNPNLAALAEAIQQPVDQGGVRMQNRRWHLRLHYNCFIGSDMIDWLLDNFEDLESREEAEELGNRLMVSDQDKEKEKDKEPRKESGIFVHVEKRHRFRDGQYFYQINSEYARPQPPAWFNSRWRDTSVPSTPISERMPGDGVRMGPSRPTSISQDTSPTSGATTPTQFMYGKKPRVVLSKVMKYDVDHRKRSYRPERIDLHYDRLHNPDNCYHLRIDWMNVTAKLIEDAVEGWAREATSYGLRLVEVPIAEACSISGVNPFRRPYRIDLAARPPDKQPATYYDPHSFGPQAQPGRLVYQKAILRRFDFVLDMESASSFPGNVDVTYSWGKPDYSYTQYIHRSGMLLAQITDEGGFLVLANRLYSNRAQAARDREMRKEEDQQQQQQKQKRHQQPKHQHQQGGYAAEYRALAADLTPAASPTIRATTTAISPTATRQQQQQQGGEVAGLNWMLAASNSAGGTNNNVHANNSNNNTKAAANSPAGTPTSEPERIKDEIERFCHDAAALAAFYQEVLEREPPQPQPASSNLAPSVVSTAGSGSGGGWAGVGVPDSHIPTFGGLPPGVLAAAGVSELGASLTSPRVPSPAVLSASQLLRRGSVQEVLTAFR